MKKKFERKKKNFFLYQECTDTLLDKLDVELQMATHELTSYK